MKVLDFLDENLIEIDLQALDKRGAIEEMVSLMARAGVIRNLDRMVNILMEREDLGSTGIGQGVAIPHGIVDEISQALGTFGRSREGIDFNALDNQPVDLLFVLIAPKGDAGIHLKSLARVSRLLMDLDLRQRLREATSKEEVMGVFAEGDKKL